MRTEIDKLTRKHKKNISEEIKIDRLM